MQGGVVHSGGMRNRLHLPVTINSSALLPVSERVIKGTLQAADTVVVSVL
jgi:hypothetical protein